MFYKLSALFRSRYIKHKNRQKTKQFYFDLLKYNQKKILASINSFSAGQSIFTNM